MKENIHFLTKSAIRECKINIHDIINLRALNVCDKNCFLFVSKAKSVIKNFMNLKVGVFLTPYTNTINHHWNQELNRIEREKRFFGGKTRYQYENRL